MPNFDEPVSRATRTDTARVLLKLPSSAGVAQSFEAGAYSVVKGAGSQEAFSSTGRVERASIESRYAAHGVCYGAL